MAMEWFVLLALAAAAHAGPVSYNRDSTTCATSCPESAKFSYETGKTYEYDYEADIKTGISGASDEHSSLHMRAVAMLEVLAPCEMVLKMTDVSLQDSSPTDYESREHVARMREFKAAMQERSLRIAYRDGHVEHVCAEPEEPTWVLNVKRAVVSHLQNTMKRLDESLTTTETDVAGECPVQYEVEGQGWSVTKVKKTKDLLGCTERLGHLTAFQSSPYRAHSAIQSLPLMKSTHECQQEVNSDRVLISCSCVENHVFRPFSRHDSGANTRVNSKLTFKQVSTGIRTQQGYISKRSSLLFEHELTPEQRDASVRQVQDTLSDLCRASQEEVTVEVPRLFAKLVRQMYPLDARALISLNRDSATICPKAEKFVRDAVPMLGSAGSVSLIRRLISNGEVTGVEADMWMTQLAFIAKPSLEMLAEIKPLLDLPQPFRKASLAVSTMVHSYCRQNPSCTAMAEVQEIIRVFEDKLRYNCKAESDESHDQILMSLKALGNTGYAHSAVQTLNRCFQNPEVSNEVRVAAIAAFRRMGCDVDRTEVRSVFSNMQVDSELRIGAYLALMQCPDENTISLVMEALKNEEVNQVGSFVWTHLTNLRESSSPHKQAIREILDDKTLQKIFDMDKRKYSRNIEMSYFSQLLNAGGQVDANLIWSQDSFIPRSAMVNLTVDVFGESVNLLELGGRVQGLERMLERLLREQDNEIERTQALDTISSLESRYNEQADQPQASYYLRIFGNEIRYGDLHDLDLASLKERLNYLDWLIELSKEHNFEFTKSFMFLDATMTVPTGAGMPIRLNVDGTTTVNVAVSGKLDIRQMFTSPSTFDIDGTIKPSAAVEVSGEMGVDAFVAKTGVRMITTLHTSTRTTGKIQLKSGKVFNLDIQAPEDETEILKAESKFFIDYRDEQREQRMLSEDRQERRWCSGNSLATVTGLELCAQASLPPRGGSDAPWFPLTGPTSTSLTLRKTDTFSNYKMDVKYLQEKVRGDDGVAVTDTALFSFNTPGSRVDRELLLEYILNRGDMSANFNFRTPWKKIGAEGSITNTNEMKRVFGIFKMDEETLFNLDAQLGINKKAVRTDYSPKLELSWPGRQPIIFQGDIGYKAGKKAEFDLRLRNLAREPIRFQGLMSAAAGDDTWKYETDLQIKSAALEGRVSALSERTPEAIMNHQYSVEYSYKGGKQERMTFSETVKDMSQGSRYSYSVESAWTTTMWPDYNQETKLDFSYDRSNMELNAQNSLGGVERLIVSSSATYNLKGTNKQLEGRANVQRPDLGLEYSGRAEYVKSDTQFKTLGSVQYAPNKEVSMEMNLVKDSSKPLVATAELSMSCPGVRLSLRDRIEEQGNSGYRQELSVEKNQEEVIRISTSYQRLPRHELSAEVTVPTYQPFTIRGHLNPDVRNLQAMGEFSQAGRSYKAEGKWLHSGSAAEFNTRGDLTIAYPARTILMEGSSSRQGDVVSVNMETKWDATRNPEKKMSVAGQVTMVKSTPAMQMKVILYPEHSIDLDVTGKYETGGWYKSTSDLEGSMRLRTSFRNWEDISASFKHDRTKTEYKTEGELSWAPGKTVEGRFDINKLRNWNKVETVMDVKTPVDGMRTLKAEVTYNLAASRMSTDAKLQWEQKVISLEVGGDLDKAAHRLQAQMRLNTPFEPVEAISANINYNDDGSSYRGNADLTWAQNKQISVEMEMQRQKSASSLTNTGSLMIGTPFEKYSVTKVAWEVQKEAEMVRCTGSLESEGTKVISTNIESRMKSSGRNWILKADGSLQSQWTNDIAIHIDHKHDKTSFSAMETEGSTQWGEGKVISYEHKMQRAEAKPLSFRAKFTSPFKGLEKISLDSQTTKANGRINSEHELKYGANSKVAATADMVINGWTAQGSMTLSTPFSGMERVVVIFQNEKQDEIWISHGDIEYAPRKKLEIDTKLGLGYRKVVGARIQSLIPHLRDAAFEVTTTGPKRNFVSAIELKHHELTGDVTLSVAANTADLKDMTLSADLNTPWAAVRFLKAEMKTKIEGDSQHLEGLFQIPTYKGAFTHDMTSRNGRSYNIHTVIEYVAGKKIDVAAEFKNARRMMGSLTWQSPFTQELNLEINHEGDYNSFSSSGEGRYGGKSITGSVDYSLQGNKMTLAGRMTTPFTDAARIVIAADHEGAWTNFKNSASIQVNDLTVNGNSEFEMGGDKLRIKAELRTPVPISGYSSFGVDLTHTGPKNNFRNEALFTFGSKRVSAQSQFTLRGTAMDLTAAIQLPISQMREINVEVHHNGPATAFTNNAIITYGSERISGSTEFNLNGNNLVAKASMQLPLRKLRTLDVEITHRGPADAFNNQATIKYNDDVISANSEFSLAGPTLKVNIRTPFSKAKKLGLELSHEGPADSFRCNMLATYNRKEVKGNVRFNLRGTRMNGKVSLELPVRSLSVLSLEVTHNGPRTDFSNSAVLIYGSNEISASSEFKLTGNTLKAKAVINTPCEDMRTVSVEVDHEGQLKDFRNNAIIKYSDKEITANSQFRLRGNSMNAHAAINMPHASVSTIAAEVTHEGSPLNFKNSATFTYGRKQVKASSEFSLEGTNLMTKASLEIPAAIRIISVEINHRGPWTSFNNDVTITIGEKQITTSGQMTLGSQSLDANMQLRSSYPAVRRVLVTMKHDGAIDNFKNNAEVAYNGKKVGFESEFSLRGHSLSTKAGLRLPIEAVNYIELTFNHNGPLNNFNENAILIVDDKQYNANGEVSMSPNYISVKANGKIPVVGDVAVELMHNGPIRAFVNKVKLIKGTSTYAGSSEFSLRRGSMIAKADLTLPYKTVRLDISHSGQISDFQNNALLAIDDAEIRGNSQFKLSGSTVMAKAELTMPYGPREISIEINHDGQWTNFNNNGMIKYGSKVISGTSLFSMEGTTTHAKAELRMPVEGLEILGIELRFGGRPKNFNGNTILTYGRKQITGDVEFSLNGDVMSGKVTISTPYAGYETMSLEINHDGSLDQFRNGITIHCGRHVMSAEAEFKIEGNKITGKLTINSPYESIRNLEASFEHNGRGWKNFDNNGVIQLNGERYTGESEFRKSDRLFRLNGELNIPDKYAIKVNHKGSRADFSNNMKITTPANRISGVSSLKLDGNKLDASANVETTFRGLRNMGITVSHEGEASNFRTRTDIVAPYIRDIGAEVSHRGSANDFESSASLSAPSTGYRSIAGTVTHKKNGGKVESGYSVSVNDKTYNGKASYKKTGNGMAAEVSAETPWANFERTAAAVSHAGGFSDFQTTGHVETSFPGYSRFAGELSHSGDMMKGQSAIKVDTPFRSMPSLSTSIKHECMPGSFEGEVSAEYGRKSLSGAASYKKSDSGVEASTSLRTPYAGYERFAAAAAHSKTASGFESSASLETPFRNWERTTGKLTHAGSLSNFRTNVEATSTAPHHESMTASLEHRGDARSFQTSFAATSSIPGHESYGATLVKSGEPKKMDLSLDLTTPIRQYEKMGAKMSHDLTSPKSEWYGELSSSYPGYEKLGLKLNHEGDMSAFKVGAEATSSKRGYERFAAGVEKSGLLDNLQVKSHVETPFGKYERMAMDMSHRGHLGDFASSVNVETTIPRYRRMGASYTHKGTATKFDCSGHVATSVPGYERISGSLSHEGDLSNFRTTGNLETPFDGHENLNLAINHNYDRSLRSSIEVTGPRNKRYAASVNHEGDLKKFDTTMQVDTPFAGYERFGVVLTHDLTDGISHSGVISLPFREIPEIKYTVSHSGHLYDFNSAATVEYAGKKIEATGFYKRTPSYAETIYEGGMTISSPFEELRNLRLTGATRRRTDTFSGELNLVHNDVQKLDMDYTYTADASHTFTLNVRNPSPFETSFSFNAENGNVLAEGAVNWNPRRRDSRVRGKFDMKCAGNTHELEMSLTLPSRTMAFSTNWVPTESSLRHQTSLQWAEDEDSRFNYQLDLSRSSRRNQEMMDGRFRLTCSGWSVDSSMALKKIPGRQYTSELTITTDQTTKITSDVTINGANRKLMITVNHPSMGREAVLSVDSTIDRDNCLYDGTVELRVGRETVTYSGRIAREAPGKYMASTRLAHPNSLTDMQWSGNLEVNAERILTTQEAKWMMSATQQFKIATLRTEINKIRKELEMDVASPIGEMRVSGRQVSASGGVYNYAAEVVLGRKSMRVETELNKPEKSVDLKVYYTQDDFLHAYAKYMSSKEVKAEVYRVHNGRRIQEAEIHLKQKADSRSLTGRTFLRPDIMDDIKTSLDTTDMGREWKSTWQSVQGAWEEELSYKKPALERSLRPVLRVYRKVADYSREYYNQIHAKVMEKYEEMNAKVMEKYEEMKAQYKVKYTEMRQKVKEMYAENKYYLKDICLWMQDAVQKSKDKYSTLKSQIGDASAVSGEYASNWWSQLRDATKELKAKIDTMSMDDIQPHLDNARSTMQGWYDQIRTHPQVRRVVERVSTMHQTWTDSDGAVAVVGSKPAAWTNYAREMWTQVSRREDIKAARDYISGHLQKNKWTADYLRLKQMAYDLVEDIKSSGIKGIVANVKSWVMDTYNADKNIFTVWDPQGGDFQFDLYIPLPLSDLQTLPKVNINLSKYYRDMREMYYRYKPEGGWSWSALYYKYKPSNQPRDWIPPFDAHATVGGRQHYMTFDKRFFEFAGECSYLLANDFIDGAFSVIVNYERASGAPVKKSITVVLGNKKLEVFPDGKVLLDNARVELPISVEDDKLVMVRDGGLIKIENTNGINLECDLVHDRCTVKVTGWYFGRTAGLFGTYNNEPYDDMTTIDRRRVENVGEFAASWASGSRCRPVNSAVDISNEVSTGSRRYELCAKYLKEYSSPFSRCFGVVDPAPFMRMCLNDMPSNVNQMETEEDVCDAASFYVKECAMQKVPIRLPSICVRCEVEGGESFTEGQNVTLREDAVPESADVVFVIHHSDCNREIVDQLKDLVDDMEKAFKADTMKNVRYAIVGYGGRGVFAKPRVHTMEGQIFNSRDKILLGLENFDTVAGEDEDAFVALKYAAMLPFRAGVSKSVILMPCQSCRQGPVTFSEIQQLLLFRDIRLHVLLQHNFELRSSAPKTAYIFGMDRDVAYTRKDAGTTELEGDMDLRRQLRVPKDLCVALTEETDGSVFNTLQWINNRPFVQKRYRDVLVRVVVEKAEPTDCQICECMPDNTGAGHSVCRNCEPPKPIYSLPSEFTRDTQLPEMPEAPAKPDKPIKSAEDKERMKELRKLNKAKRQREARRLRLARKRSQQS